MLTGDNGLINQTINANKQTDIAGTREQIELELMARYDTEGNYTNDDVIEAVKTVTGQDIEEGTETVTTDKGNEVDISDLWKVTGGSVDTIPTDTNYEGYYADIDGDGTVDGLIYADLAIGGSGKWNSDSYSRYEYSATTDLKKYYESQESYTDDFGEKSVLAPVKGTTGNDRFYVMALDNFTTSDYSTFYWYYSAYSKKSLDRIVAPSYNDFGEGKANTINMIDDWNNKSSTYGDPNARDLWGVIQSPTDNATYGKNSTYSIVTSTSDSGKWFVPSKAEWSAFGDYLYTSLGVTKNNYGDYGLSATYWSTSQATAYLNFSIGYSTGTIGLADLSGLFCVRLSTTY